MLSKNELKYLKSLKQRKFRQKYDIFIAEGVKVIEQFMASQTFELETLFYVGDLSKTIEKHIPNHHKIKITQISREEMIHISQLSTASDYLLLVKKAADHDPLKISKGRYLYLDGLQDPGNVGTLIRIADWFGLDGVMRSDDTADFFHPKTVMATMGSMVNVPLYTVNVEDLKSIKLPIIGTTMEGETIYTYEWPQNGVLVIGNEGQGMRSEIIKLLTSTVSIPGTEGRVAESLNAAVAGSLCIGEWFRLSQKILK